VKARYVCVSKEWRVRLERKIESLVYTEVTGVKQALVQNWLVKYHCFSCSFYVECTSIRGIDSFRCKKANVHLFENPKSDLQDETGQNWIMSANSEAVKSEFLELAGITRPTR